mmetsp:Transcript_137186/g.273755  ORF Transcript_137186/g.273755 Transcript_137186/m.273755 type:complete len:261 (-) Transcript_137186:632-1414(-)
MSWSGGSSRPFRVKKPELVGPLKIEMRSRLGFGFLVALRSALRSAAFTAKSRAAFRVTASSSSGDMVIAKDPAADVESSIVSSRDRMPRDWPRSSATLPPPAPPRAPSCCCNCKTAPGPGLQDRAAPESRRLVSPAEAIIAATVGLLDRVAPTGPAGRDRPHREKTSLTASRTARTLSCLTTSRALAMRRCSGVGRAARFAGSGNSKARPNSGLSPMTCSTSAACFRVCQSDEACKHASRHGKRQGNASSNSWPSTFWLA